VTVALVSFRDYRNCKMLVGKNKNVLRLEAVAQEISPMNSFVWHNDHFLQSPGQNVRSHTACSVQASNHFSKCSHISVVRHYQPGDHRSEVRT